jgi:hypothetical protein
MLYGELISGPKTKKDYAGKGQQQFTGLDCFAELEGKYQNRSPVSGDFQKQIMRPKS